MTMPSLHWRTLSPTEGARPSRTLEDRIAGRILVVPQADEDELWRCVERVMQDWRPPSMHDLARLLYGLLDGCGRIGGQPAPFPHPAWAGALPSRKLAGARISDRAFLASGAAACMLSAEDGRIRDTARVWALADEFPDSLRSAVEGQVRALGGPTGDGAGSEPLSHALLLASDRLDWKSGSWAPPTQQSARQEIPRADFEQHPLSGASRIGLVMGGAQQVKAYFLESARLPEIRGASALLDYVNHRAHPAIFDDEGLFAVPECIIYCGGGNVLALCPEPLVHAAADRIEEAYGRITDTARAAAAGMLVTPLEMQYGLHLEPAPDGAAFGQIAGVLAMLVRERRNGCPLDGRAPLLPPQSQVTPFSRRCTSCGLRAAAVHPEDDEGASGELCGPCTRKAVAGRLARNGRLPRRWRQAAERIGFDYEALDLQGWTDRFEAHRAAGGERPDAEAAEAPLDLSEIGADHVGVIYADGNNVGQILTEIRTAAEYRRFSQELYGATLDAVLGALAQNVQPHVVQPHGERRRAARVHRFQILSVGGDDLFLIVPAEEALKIACEISERIERRFDGSAPTAAAPAAVPAMRYAGPNGRAHAIHPRLTVASGVVIAATSTPIHSVRGLCEELQKLAKKLTRERSCVDFQVLKSVGNLTCGIADYRRAHLTRRGGGGNLFLTARPYTVPELRGLLDTAAAFRSSRLPRSQIYRLRSALLAGKETGALEYLYARARARDERSRELFDTLDDRWGASPWMTRTDRDFETVLPDLIEILPFAEAPKGDQP